MPKEQSILRPAVPGRISACLFDLDGVLTQTAKVHAAAWKHMFDDFLLDRSNRTGEPFRAFDPTTDYARSVDGKLRADGVRAFLASRSIAARRLAGRPLRTGPSTAWARARTTSSSSSSASGVDVY